MHFVQRAAWRAAALPRRTALTRAPFTGVRSSSTSTPPIFQLTSPNIFPYDTSRESHDAGVLHDVDWQVGNNDAWGFLSAASSPSKKHLIDVLRSHIRVQPAAAASHPILEGLPLLVRPAEEGGSRQPTVSDIIQFVSFKTTLSSTGEFEDFTARYYHIRDEDKLTVRRHLEQSLSVGKEEGDPILDTAKLLKIDHLLELPLVTLSNGQTRRARILRALLAKPELLILEEPFTGLDVDSRALLTSLLAALHANRSPRILLILRPQDPLPPFVTHVALVSSAPGVVALGPRDSILASAEAKALLAAGAQEREAAEGRRQRRKESARKQREASVQGKPLIELRRVNVEYGPEEKRRVVLKDVDWTIREGERWILAGHNGSGKSTLLSIVLGDHPRSYVEDVTMFGKPRYSQATATIQANIGHVSPEISNAFPRKFGPGGLTAKEAIMTGFDSIFCYRRPTEAQEAALTSLLTSFSYPLLTPTFLSQPFAALPPAEQSLILFLRALVKRPPLLVLDECFAGMNSEMVDAVKRFLDEELGKEQAVVVISHFEEEVPESVCRLLKLEGGMVVEKW